ncbi:HAD family hydrolase [Amycolatopsis anabasis]|uniref:HAD family hydrolase n=1 Tax=Amycolatopsis anabasis TaxID=1840409 RepID=UPI00131BFA19|nr:HAD family hydrolase [Amycolatopsis anabasis]
MISAVVFDIGETLLDDSRECANWADWIGVPRHTFSAVIGAVTALGRDNLEAFQLFRPGFDLAAERRRRDLVGRGEVIEEADLYPDTRPALAALRALGLWVGVAGNQTARTGELLRELDLPVDAIATSEEWGAAKPDAAFFDRVVELAPGADPGEILYVGDNPGNDVTPARARGLRTALIRHGPHGWLLANDPAVSRTADWVVGSLTELVPILADQRGRERLR